MHVAAGRIRRLLVTMPPRYGKSERCSRYFPAWWLGNWPDGRIILAGYGNEFAGEWGRKVRNALVASHAQGIFPAGVDPQNSAADSWSIAGHEGGLHTAGIGGAVTGIGADLFVIDDPIKSRVEAESPTVREKLWQWYTDDAYTRLHPGGRIVLVQTRWHYDDLAGRILASAQAADWTVLNLPAFAEEDDLLGREVGEPLWPERFGIDDLRDKEATLGSYSFAALYQQRPMPREGGLFKRHWFDVVGEAPVDAKRVRFWDLAGTKGGGDWTVGVRIARNGTGHTYVEDVKRAQESPGEVERLIKQTAELDGREVRVYIEQEPGSSGAAVIGYYTKALAGFTVRGVRATGPKELRAEPFAAQAEAGNVRVVRAAWNDPWLDELCTFPMGAHDDQVDATSGAFAQLTQRNELWFV